MEEILASIRAIIADDGPMAPKAPAPVRPTAPAVAQVIYSNFGQKAQELSQPTVVSVAAGRRRGARTEA